MAERPSDRARRSPRLVDDRLREAAQDVDTNLDMRLQQRQEILEIDRKPIKDLSDYQKAIADVKQGKAILFLIRRGENTIFLALKS